MGKVRRVDLYPDEWLVGAATLRPDERGCYITVCCLIYSYGAPIDDDERDLAKLCNTTIEKWRRIREKLLARRKLRLENGKLTNGRCETELEKATKRTEKAQESGHEGGINSGISRRNRKRVSNQSNDLSEADASIETKLTTNHQPPTKNPSLKGRIESIGQQPLGHDPSADETSLRTGDPQTTDGQGDEAPRSTPEPQSQDPNASFGEWWQHVPHKVSKGHAEKAYRSAVKGGATPAELLAGIQRYARQVAGTEPRFIKHPSSWLNGKCWLDEPPPVAAHSHRGHDHDQRDQSRVSAARQRPDSLFSDILERDLAGRA